jgi:hypothetical protein
LDALGRRLASLQQRLDSLSRDVGAYDAAIGAHELRAALSELISAWNASRLALGQELANLGSLASDAAAHYRATDLGVATDVGRLPGGP